MANKGALDLPIPIYFAFICSVGVVTRRIWKLSVQNNATNIIQDVRYNAVNFRMYLNR